MQKAPFVQELIQRVKKVNKSDAIFKVIKKLKQAVETIEKMEGKEFHQIMNNQPTKSMIVFYFGTGIEADYNILKSQNSQQFETKLIVGVPYGHMQFTSVQKTIIFCESCQSIERIHYKMVKFEKGQRLVFYFYTRLKYEELQIQQKFDIQNCATDEEIVPGLICYDNFLTLDEQLYIAKEIDKRKWNRLSNRKVQHYGYEFKYGKNSIDKQEKYQQPIPQFFNQILERFQHLNLCKHSFDQLTINCYDPGDGIPAHFDTHSPFEQIFLSISLLSNIVMEFVSHVKQTKQVLLKNRSLVAFSGQARYAWTHAIANRKMDKIDNKIVYRLRRISLTFRKIRNTPCVCKYYFYCDSQGYDADKMKKNNPLLKKYLAQKNKVEIKQGQDLQKQYVEKAYNSFGYTFSNPIHPIVNKFIKDIEAGSLVLDIGCGNGFYMDLIEKYHSIAIGLQKCIVMKGKNVSEQRLYGDALNIPFRSNTFDIILMVAVYHHFSTIQNRIKSIQQIQRLLAKGGQVMVSVWSFEHKAEIYEDQDIFVDFALPKHRKNENIQAQQKAAQNSHNEIYKRYYHLFRKQELIDLIRQNTHLKIVSIEAEYDNYYLLLKK